MTATETDLHCPECGAPMIRKYGKYGGFFSCCRFPLCQGTHGMNQRTGLPLGVPGDTETRRARQAAHDAADQLWKGGVFRRKEVYEIIADLLGIPLEEAHIGMFDAARCRDLVKRLIVLGLA